MYWHLIGEFVGMYSSQYWHIGNVMERILSVFACIFITYQIKSTIHAQYIPNTQNLHGINKSRASARTWAGRHRASSFTSSATSGACARRHAITPGPESHVARRTPQARAGAHPGRVLLRGPEGEPRRRAHDRGHKACHRHAGRVDATCCSPSTRPSRTHRASACASRWRRTARSTKRPRTRSERTGFRSRARWAA